jgi:hypothetical protein
MTGKPITRRWPTELQSIRRRIAAHKRALDVLTELESSWRTGIATPESVVIIVHARSLHAMLDQQTKPLAIRLRKAERAKARKLARRRRKQAAVKR